MAENSSNTILWIFIQTFRADRGSSPPITNLPTYVFFLHDMQDSSPLFAILVISIQNFRADRGLSPQLPLFRYRVMRPPATPPRVWKSEKVFRRLTRYSLNL